MKDYQVVLQSENIDYVKLDIDLIGDYLIMINGEDIQKKILTKRKV